MQITDSLPDDENDDILSKIPLLLGNNPRSSNFYEHEVYMNIPNNDSSLYDSINQKLRKFYNSLSQESLLDDHHQSKNKNEENAMKDQINANIEQCNNARAAYKMTRSRSIL